MYKCSKCGKPMENMDSWGFQCKECGSKIFFMVRPDGKKKVLKSD